MTSGIGIQAHDEREKDRSLEVAAAALHCDRDPCVNRVRMTRMVQEIVATNPGVELILFGELITSWYEPDCGEYCRESAETLPGETTRAMAALARRHNLYISFGLTETSAGRLYNSQVLVNPVGDLQAVHRKTFPASDLFASGRAPVTITKINGVRTGLAFCADAVDARAMWKIAGQPLDLLLLSMADECYEGLSVARATARMCRVWLVMANRSGEQNGHSWNGNAAIVDPTGVLRVVIQNEAQYVSHPISIVSSQPSAPKRLLRHIKIKTPLIPHVLQNRGRARAHS